MPLIPLFMNSNLPFNKPMTAKWALVIACLLSAPAAVAQPGDSETRLLARDLATQGADAFDRGDFALALDRFSRASTMLDAPTITLMEGRTLVKLGRWTEALDRFHRIAHASLAPDAPAAFQVAINDAATEAQALELQMPRLNVAASSEVVEAGNVVVTIDGVPVPKVMLNIARPVDPGLHVVRATSNGVEYFTSTVDLHPQEGLQVTVPTYVPPPPPPPVVVPPKVEVVAQPVPAPDKTASAPWPWLLPVGVGAAALGGVGAVVSGVLATGYRSHLNRVCTRSAGDYVCPPEERRQIEGLELQRGLFVASTAVGVLGVALTTYVLIASSNEPSVALLVSPQGAALSGRF
jgi:hypothetical protein